MRELTRKEAFDTNGGRLIVDNQPIIWEPILPIRKENLMPEKPIIIKPVEPIKYEIM